MDKLIKSEPIFNFINIDFSLYLCVLSTAVFIFFSTTTCSRNPSIYCIYGIIGISRLCGTGNKNICGIYSTISTMFILLFENNLETLCASVYIVYYNTLFYKLHFRFLNFIRILHDQFSLFYNY